MIPRSRSAADRMMRALCLCDTGGIHTAVRRYLDTVQDAELRNLLRGSLKDLDSYYRMQLEPVLTAGIPSSSGEAGELRRLFASFVAQNPRSLEQLSPAMIEGVLQQRTIEDPNLAGEFRMPSRRRYGFVVTGLSGALCTVVLFFAYVRLNSQNT
ncbi:MAG: hypothetical protein M3160_10090, partial [Candidatus Eremiobacteraeota bacterium]|nr:hypothetical protein [Candidatus Eremiobacteraeota bacterium]